MYWVHTEAKNEDLVAKRVHVCETRSSCASHARAHAPQAETRKDEAAQAIAAHQAARSAAEMAALKASEEATALRAQLTEAAALREAAAAAAAAAASPPDDSSGRVEVALICGELHELEQLMWAGATDADLYGDTCLDRPNSQLSASRASSRSQRRLSRDAFEYFSRANTPAEGASRAAGVCAAPRALVTSPVRGMCEVHHGGTKAGLVPCCTCLAHSPVRARLLALSLRCCLTLLNRPRVRDLMCTTRVLSLRIAAACAQPPRSTAQGNSRLSYRAASLPSSMLARRGPPHCA